MRMTLKAARINKGLTQQEVADELRVNKQTIGRWERGITVPKIDQIKPICELYGVSFDDIKWHAR